MFIKFHNKWNLSLYDIIPKSTIIINKFILNLLCLLVAPIAKARDFITNLIIMGIMNPNLFWVYKFSNIYSYNHIFHLLYISINILLYIPIPTPFSLTVQNGQLI